MRQIAAASRRDRLLQQIASCDMRNSLSLRSAAVIQTGLKSCDISQRQNERKQPCRSISADEATCRRDVSQRQVSHEMRWRCSFHFLNATNRIMLTLQAYFARSDDH